MIGVKDGWVKHMALTGRFCFRLTRLGKVALVVEEEKPRFWPFAKASTRKRWRDASLMDLAHHELRKILDLQHRLSASVEHPIESADGLPQRQNSSPAPAVAVGDRYQAMRASGLR